MLRPVLRARRILHILCLCLFGLLVALLPTTTLCAISNPTNIGIGGTAVFKDLLSPGDQLWFMRYTVSYSSVPSGLASNYFEVAIYNSDGTFTGYSRGLNYYQENIISIYLTPAQALTWGGAYKFRVMGYPSVFSPLIEGVNMKTQVMSPSSYMEFSLFAGYLIGQAQQLQTNWGLTLLTSPENLLNTTGSTYFSYAIPGLVNIVPTIFQYSSYYPMLNATAWTNATATNFTAHKGALLTSAINSTAGWLGTTFSWMQLFLAGFICFMLAAVSYPIVKTPGNSMVMGSFGLPLCMYIGILEMNIWLMLFIIVGILFGVLFIQGRLW